MIDDLRHFRVPSWWRENAQYVWAGVFAALVVAAMLIPEAKAQTMRFVGLSHPVPCTGKSHHGLWIAHRGDRVNVVRCV